MDGGGLFRRRPFPLGRRSNESSVMGRRFLADCRLIRPPFRRAEGVSEMSVEPPRFPRIVLSIYLTAANGRRICGRCPAKWRLVYSTAGAQCHWLAFTAHGH